MDKQKQNSKKEKTKNNTTLDKRHKPIEELNLIDDFLFNELMLNKDYGKKVIKYFLDIILEEVVLIKDVQVQVICTSNDPNKRAIRMDVVTEAKLIQSSLSRIILEDNKKDGTIIDFEMQKQKKDIDKEQKNNIRKRSRFYQALQDVRALNSGDHFDNLNNIIIIICIPFDLFGRNRMKYTFENCCIEEPDLLLEDGAKRIFLNTKGTRGGNKELKELLEYIEDSSEKNVKNEKLKDIHEMVTDIKHNKEVSVKYMLAMEHEYEIRKEGREEGIKEGEAKIIAKIIDIIKKKFSKGMSIEIIADVLEQDKEYVQNIISLLSAYPDLSTVEIAKLLMEDTD